MLKEAFLRMLGDDRVATDADKFKLAVAAVCGRVSGRQARLLYLEVRWLSFAQSPADQPTPDGEGGKDIGEAIQAALMGKFLGLYAIWEAAKMEYESKEEG